ncbi:MAG: alpha/beta hydrolase [Bryobacteraceae bacterium]|jgi:pimeloyl-ACP methyl ester carboxylesterase
MKRLLWKTARIVLLSLLGIVVGLAAWLLALRLYHQHALAESIAIHTPNGIEEGMYVRIGGIEQWIQIRGQDRNNPVLLFLHGGPGGTLLPMTELFVPWEKAFTLVQWDQRGAGKTLETTGASVAATMSIDRMTRDGIEVSEFLRTHLHKDKIILLGHSWGSILGIYMIRQRPDLFYAWVGTGQVGNMPESLRIGYARLLEKARAKGDPKVVQALEKMGPPPFRTMRDIGAYFRLLQDYEPKSDRDAMASPVGSPTHPAPHFSLGDEFNRIRGFALIPPLRMYEKMFSTDLPSLGLDFKIPVFFFQGADDARTLAPVAKEYFDEIDSPHKEFVLFEGGGHFAIWSMSGRFLHELIVRVRPFALPPSLAAPQ